MITIFMYHQVAEVPVRLDPLGLAVPPAQFEQQMDYLSRGGYSCLSLAEAAQYLRTGRRMPARSFVITFDDGYQDVLTNASPILEKYGFTAAIFLVAGRMGAPSDWWSQNDARSGTLLTWDEVRGLARKGFILGSHSFSHPFLNRLDDCSAREEIERSKVVLEDRLDMQIEFFSYPYSETNARIEGLVEAAGYTAACAGYMGPWSIYNLWRVPCGRGDTAMSFRLKAGGWYNGITALRESAPGRLLRRYVRAAWRRLNINPPHYSRASNSDLGLKTSRDHD